MSTLIFLWLHNQTFYKNLQTQALEPIASSDTHKKWADIGCSTGLITRLAQKLNYNVTGYDINTFSLFISKLLAYNVKNISYIKKDFFTLHASYDIVSATSLLSVVEDPEDTLHKLISLMKDNSSTLIIIEPSKYLSRKNVWKQIHNIKTFWHYRGLLLWAKARENKHIDNSIFEALKNVKLSQKYYLHDMVCVTYIQKTTIQTSYA